MWPYEIDWSATGAMLSGWGSILAGAGTIALAIIAFRTFKRWRDQARYLEDRRIAIEALALFEEGRQAIKEIRSPQKWPQEFRDAVEKINSTKDGELLKGDFRYYAILQTITFARIHKHQETWDKIIKLVNVMKAVFGNDEKKLMWEIFKARAKIIASATIIDSDLDKEQLAKMKSLLEWKVDEDTDKAEEEGNSDPIYDDILSARSELFKRLEPYIKEQSQSLSF